MIITASVSIDKVLDKSGVQKLWDKIKEAFADKNHTHSEATTSTKGFLSAADKQIINNLPNVYAKKSDIVNVYVYKGSVATYDELPSNDLKEGYVYNVEDTGKNYAWTGSNWDDLGGSFEINMQPITEDELNEICI